MPIYVTTLINASHPTLRKVIESEKTVCKRKIMNILIIEDDAAIRQELKLLLENALYQVTVLTEFHHVVEDILQMEPDLLLLDVNLPQQSGFEICKSVRKTSDVPIIFLTSRTDSMDELSGMLRRCLHHKAVSAAVTSGTYRSRIKTGEKSRHTREDDL